MKFTVYMTIGIAAILFAVFLSYLATINPIMFGIILFLIWLVYCLIYGLTQGYFN